MSRLIKGALLLCCFVVASAAAGASETWIRLLVERQQHDTSTLELKVKEGQGFFTGIQLSSQSRAVKLSNLVVQYGNGQVDDLGEIDLLANERTTIVERPPNDARSITSIVASFSRSLDATNARFEVFALEPSAVVTRTLTAEELMARQQNNTSGAARKFKEVVVHYGTTRKRGPDIEKYARKLATYGSGLTGDLALGRAIVTVPVTHGIGAVERPNIDWIVWNYRAEDPGKHFTIAATDESERTFRESLRTHLSNASKFKRQALVFVHGYNTSFDDAAFRAAQLGHDIEFDGPIVMFSWPARSGFLNKIRYGADLEAASAARPALAKFLAMLAADRNIEGIHIVAHSMGGGPVLEVLAEHGRQRNKASSNVLKLRNVVLAAPDVSEQLFSQLTSDLRGWSSSVTLLTSSNDRAIAVSRAYTDQPRAGGATCGDRPTLGSPHYFLIDVTQADTSFLGVNHSTFAERRHVIADLKLLLETGKQPPHERMPVYERHGQSNAPCWRYVKN